MRRSALPSLRRHQRGATLVVALLILVLIMMIGITAVSTSNTQFRLAGNLQFEDSAMNNAEAAIAKGDFLTAKSLLGIVRTMMPTEAHVVQRLALATIEPVGDPEAAVQADELHGRLAAGARWIEAPLV